MHANVGVRAGAVTEGTLVLVLLGILDLLFLYHFLAFDKASSAVFTGLGVLGPCGTAAWTGGIILDQRSGDLFLGSSSGIEARTAGVIVGRLDCFPDQDNDEHQKSEAQESGTVIGVAVIVVSVAVASVGPYGLGTVKSECIARVGHADLSEFRTFGETAFPDQASVLGSRAVAVRDNLVRIPVDNEIVDGDILKPSAKDSYEVIFISIRSILLLTGSHEM